MRESVDDSLGAPLASPDDVLTAEEVASLLRMTPAWVYSETRQDRIPHMRFGRRFRYRRSAIEAWMTSLERSRLSEIRIERQAAKSIETTGRGIARVSRGQRDREQQARLF